MPKPKMEFEFDEKTKMWKEVGLSKEEAAKRRKADREKLKELKKKQKAWEKAQAKCADLRKLEDEAWKKYIPSLQKEVKNSPKTNWGIWGDFLPDGVRTTEINILDSAGQKIDFRVGPVFGAKGVYKEPGIWIGYQRRYMCSDRQGDILISPEIWRQLTKEMERKLYNFDAKHYGPSSPIAAKKPKKGTS